MASKQKPAPVDNASAVPKNDEQSPQTPTLSNDHAKDHHGSSSSLSSPAESLHSQQAPGGKQSSSDERPTKRAKISDSVVAEEQDIKPKEDPIQEQGTELVEKSVERSVEKLSPGPGLEPATGVSASTPPKSSDGDAPPDRYPSPPEEQATKLDKETWGGFCEIESEPAYFNAMIQDMGVKDVSIREAWALDPACFDFLPKPVYGIILLFRYRVVDPQDDEEEAPDNVWFANQMPASNSCATLAIINILMNVKGVDIGENLQQFKDFTATHSPYLRGQSFSDFKFLKTIHNAYAKKMDMLNADWDLKKKSDRAKKMKGLLKNKKRSRASSSSSDEDENAFHFIAFMPIDGEVWKLDGMDYVPQSIGKFKGDDWLATASERIQNIMAEKAESGYSLMAMVPPPLKSLRKEMCQNIAIAKQVEGRLTTIDTDWKSFVAGDIDAGLPSPSLLASFGISEDDLESATVPQPVTDKVESESLADLIDRRERALRKLVESQNSIMEEMEREAGEREKAEARKWDYGPAIALWLRKLAENGYLEKNLDRFIDQ